MVKFRSNASDHETKDLMAENLLDSLLVKRYEGEYESLDLVEFIN